MFSGEGLDYLAIPILPRSDVHAALSQSPITLRRPFWIDPDDASAISSWCQDMIDVVHNVLKGIERTDSSPDKVFDEEEVGVVVLNHDKSIIPLVGKV